jgi:AcrR family transcriptional regulator
MSTAEGTAGNRRAAAKATRAPSRLREAQRELARQKLLEAATAAFEADGYVDVTVDQIVQGAGTSRGTFYLYFQSKSEVLRAIIEQLRAEVIDAGLFASLAEMEEPTVDALQQWFERYIDFYLNHERLWAAVHQALVIEPGVSEIIKQGIDDYVALWRSSPWFKAKRPKPKDLRLAATMTFTLVDRFLYLWLSLGQDIDRRRATRALAEAVYATLA